MGDENTNITTLGGLMLLALCLGVFVSRRRWIATPLIIASSWLTLGQRVVWWDINLPALRVVILAIVFRMIVRGEWLTIRTTRIDRLFLIWTILRVVTFTVLWVTADAFVNRFGYALDGIGLYFGFRLALRQWEDVLRVVKTVALVLLPVAALMVAERMSGFNQFSLLGGVPEWSIVRDGIVRSQGPFSHPILAGTVGAVWFPAFYGLWRTGSSPIIAIIGMIGGIAMTATSGSSGPIMTLLFSLISLSFWGMRHRMRVVRRGIVGVLLLVQVFMSEPIWFIFARVNVLSASTGWHRSFLIDMSVKHFFEWFLVGVKDVGIWGVFASDITNQYLLEGLRGGIVTMWVFILIIVRLFSTIGVAMRSELFLPPGQRKFIWALGATLVGHVATFFSVAYFESQSMMHWFLVSALVIAAGAYVDDTAIEIAEESEGYGEPNTPSESVLTGALAS